MLRAPGFDQAERLESLERPVDELAGEAPHLTDRRTGPQLGRDVVAVPGPLDEQAEHRPLVERERRPAFHRLRLPRPRASIEGRC